MRFLARPAFLAAVVLGAMLSGATAQTTQKQGTGVITGRVTLGEKAAPGVVVLLFAPERMHERGVITKATTDYEGRYRLTGVPAGRYNVVAVAPAMIGPAEGMYGDTGKAVTISEAETVEKIDFPLVRGGVITGRVTNADGDPVIGERVQINPVGQPGRSRGFSNFNPFMYETDDRGVYRVYGIAPGKYTVSIGQSPDDEDGVNFGMGGRGYYARTYHPDVTEQAKATVIEISEGSEASNVNITVGRKAKSFAATGRVVDESGKPVANVTVGHGALLKEGNGMGAFGWGTASDAQGRFRLEGLLPGRYAAFVWPEGSTEGYTDPVIFEIAEGNISGLELKLLRGSTLSGVVVIEGTADRAILARLSQLSIGISVETEALATPNFSNATVAPDGSFRFTGLHPGRASLFLSNRPPQKGFSLARVERDGTAQRQIEITRGAQLSGVRIVIEYGTGVLRGLVKVENGPLPEDTRIIVSAVRRGDTTEMIRHGAQVDSRGRYVIEGMSTGEYEITLQTYINTPPPQRRLPPIKQNVTIANGVEAEANFTVDLNARQPEGGNNE